MKSIDSLASSGHFATFATSGSALAADVDLTVSPYDASRTFEGSRRITCGVAGTLVVVMVEGGSQSTLYFDAGETVDVQCSRLVASGSTAQKIRVLW